MPTLQYELVVSGLVPQNVSERVPNGDRRTWSPITSTLIYGDVDAVLVDPQMTADQAREVVDRVKASGRRLRSIYLTHAHGDHWLGAPVVLSAFPDAVLLATGATADEVRRQSHEDGERFWDRLFPGQIPTGALDVQEVPAAGITLEGEELHPVEVGHSDTDDTTVLWVPSIRLVVAGDVIYNGVHQYLSESRGGGRDAWRRAIAQVAELDPANVVAGHKDPARDDDPATIALTKAYLDDADRLLDEARTSREFFDAMLALHPDRLNPGALWGGAVALYADL